jgi:hypothetical protein
LIDLDRRDEAVALLADVLRADTANEIARLAQARMQDANSGKGAG